MKIKSQEAKVQVVQEFQEQIAKLKAYQFLAPGFEASGYILQFGNGLAVKVVAPYECHVCAIWAASVYMSPRHAFEVGKIENGAGEVAYPVKIAEACKAEIAKIEGLIAQIEGAEVLAA